MLHRVQTTGNICTGSGAESGPRTSHLPLSTAKQCLRGRTGGQSLNRAGELLKRWPSMKAGPFSKKFNNVRLMLFIFNLDIMNGFEVSVVEQDQLHYDNSSSPKS